jgi:large subunit ribosomal protein L21
MGKQFKVAPDDVIVADKIEDMDIGETFDIEDVLLVGSEMDTVIGRPYVPGVRVIAEVEEQTKDRKVIAFKMRRRKNSKRLKGFRRQVSILRILEIYRSGEHFENK